MITNMISGLGMIIVALIAFAIARTRYHAGWQVLALGALAWVVTVALKFAWAIPVNTYVYFALMDNLGEQLGSPVLWVYIGLLTGIFECGLLYLILRFLPFFRNYGSNDALLFGIAFGAVEALLLGVLALIPALLVQFAPELLPSAIATQIQPAPLFALPAGTIERIMVILVHIVTTYAVFLSIRTGDMRYFWFAFLFKSALDTVAAWAQLEQAIVTPGGLWLTEAVIAGFGIAALWTLPRLRRHWPPEQESRKTPA